MSNDFAVQSRSRMERQMVVRSYRSREGTHETCEGTLWGGRERTGMKKGNISKHQEKQKKWGKRKFSLGNSVSDKNERSSNGISYRGSEHAVKVEGTVGNSDNLRFTKRLYKMFSRWFFWEEGSVAGGIRAQTIRFHRLERFYFHALWVGVPCTAFWGFSS